MPNRSRRYFLKLAASVGGAVAVKEVKPLYAESQPAPGPVRAWSTTAQQKFQPIQSPPQWESGEELSPLAIYLEPATPYQEILGFGGAFTDASCYLRTLWSLMLATHFCRISMAHLGLRLSVGRTCIGTSDYSTKMYSYDDSPEPDPELETIPSIEQDQAWIVPTLHEAQAINPIFTCSRVYGARLDG